MTDLIPTINNIIKYGLQPDVAETDKEQSLERNLVKLYDLYFDIVYEFDRLDYSDCVKPKYSEIRECVESNFETFGYYNTVLSQTTFGIGDAVDDLSDIILDLLEIKWRIENNSLADGLWYFELSFNTHTKQHLLDLLTYLKQNHA